MFCHRSDQEREEPVYACQATQVFEASEPLAWWDIRQYWRDIVTGNHSVMRVLRATVLGLLRWSHSRVNLGYKLSKLNQFCTERTYYLLSKRSMPRLSGKIPYGGFTPTGRLNLKQGDLVRVKSLAEIEQTLDVRGQNRGLSFDPEEMAPYCGRVFKVKGHVTRIINELTGKMMHMKQPCVVLEGVLCSGEYASCRLNCPRAIPPYWRELWLEPIDQLSIKPVAAVNRGTATADSHPSN